MEATLQLPSAPPRPARRVSPGLLLAFAGASVFLVVLSGFNFLDPDVFHEMALFREILHEGRVPRIDHFAYTPTIMPVVHHEWGTGAVLYGVSRFGPAGLLVLRYALATAIAALAVLVARARAAQWISISVIAPLAAIMASYGLGTVRAQGFTLLFTAILLLMLETDRAGSRWWLYVWPILYVIWLNMHAGFVVGVGILGAYAIERFAETGRVQWRLVGLGSILAALVLVNPYGTAYPKYLLYALPLARHGIGEWGPVWTDGWVSVCLFAAAALAFTYAMYRAGWRRMPGWVIYLACAYMALRHVRHFSFLGLVIMAYLPAWLQVTPIGEALAKASIRHPRPLTGLALVLGIVCLTVTVYRKPWRLRIPCTPQDVRDEQLVIYPYGAVQYLKESGFHGNVMTPFMAGGFVSWELYPAVKVSLDGRFEVAYPLPQVSEMVAFYAARPGWRTTLDRYPTDLVLVQEVSPLAKPLAEQTAWQRVYRDGVFELFARPGLSLPVIDERGDAPAGTFP